MYSASMERIPHVLLSPLFFDEQEHEKKAKNEQREMDGYQTNIEPSWRQNKAMCVSSGSNLTPCQSGKIEILPDNDKGKKTRHHKIKVENSLVNI